MAKDGGVPKKRKKKQDSPFSALESMRDKLAKDAGAKHAAKPPPPERPQPVERSGAKVADADDALTFHRMMSGVAPMYEGPSRIGRSSGALEPAETEALAKRREGAKKAADTEADIVHEHLCSLVEGATRFEVSDDGRRVEGRRVDLAPDVLRKLRRGHLPVDARLDLHGMRSEQAQQALCGFLDDKRARGERLLLVVHGKGEHSPRGLGVLRGEIAAWLSQGAASRHVAAFCTATAADGGEGAVYVLLRR